MTSDELPKITTPAIRIQTPLEDFPIGQSVTKLLPHPKDLPGSVFRYEDPAADIECKTAPKRQKPKAMVVADEGDTFGDHIQDHDQCIMLRVADSIPQSYVGAMNSLDAEKWKEVAEKEMSALLENDTWELCDLPKGQNALPTKWVFDKCNPGVLKERFKARLVARGDIAIKGIDFEESYAPVVKMVSVRLLLVIFALLDLEIEHWDIVVAFLNSIIDHKIYIKQPQGFEDGSTRVCRLKKAIYGLPQSARTFYF